MVGALQQLIDEILQISDADVSARLSLIEVEQSYRLEYDSDFRTFQNLYDSETLRIARSSFSEDCVKVFKQLHTRVQQMLEVTPRPALAHVIFQDHVRDFLRRQIKQDHPCSLFYESLHLQSSLSTYSGLPLTHLLVSDYIEESRTFDTMGRGFKAVLVASVTAQENLASVWLQNGLGVVPVVPGHDLSAAHLKESFLKLVHYIDTFHGHDCLISTFRKFLNPLTRFPRQYISSILENDVVTLLQEYTQAHLGVLPKYTYSLVGGSDHAPQFAAEILNLRELNASAVASSKAEARKLASAACVAKIEASTRHRSRLRSLLHEKIATQRVKLGGGGGLRVPYRARGLIEGLRARHFVTLRVEEVAMALTMPGDVARLPHLGYAQTNESAAFCGSGLLEYFCDRAGIRQIHQRHDYRIDRLAGELLEIRRVLWPRGDEVSREKMLDLLQAIFYLQYKKEGLEATFAIFERCLGDTSVSPSSLLQGYDDSVQYMSILQERTQGIDRCLPSYEFTLLSPKHLTHAPIFRCIAHYHNMMGAGEGSSKRGARNRAAFELLRALGDDRNHEESASGETSG